MVGVRIASDGWNSPGTAMYIFSRDVVSALHGVGVDAIPGPIANFRDGRRIGGTVRPVLRCLFRSYDFGDGRLVHHTGWPPSGLRGAEVVTFFDMYAFRDPDPASALRRLAYRAMARRARAIVAISPFSAQEVAQHLGPRIGAKVATVSLPFPPPPPAPQVPTLYDALWVGADLPRKGLANFLRATASFPDLEIAVRWNYVRPGQASPQVEAALATRPSERLHHLHEVLDDAAMEQLYASSRCVVSTSTYEGYHAPLMEAYLRGRPIVVPDEEPYQGIYGAAPGVVRYHREGGGQAIGEAIREAIALPKFAPDPRVVDWCSFDRVGRELKAIYEGAARS